MKNKIIASVGLVLLLLIEASAKWDPDEFFIKRNEAIAQYKQATTLSEWQKTRDKLEECIRNHPSPDILEVIMLRGMKEALEHRIEKAGGTLGADKARIDEEVAKLRAERECLAKEAELARAKQAEELEKVRREAAANVAKQEQARREIEGKIRRMGEAQAAEKTKADAEKVEYKRKADEAAANLSAQVDRLSKEKENLEHTIAKAEAKARQEAEAAAQSEKAEQERLIAKFKEESKNLAQELEKQRLEREATQGNLKKLEEQLRTIELAKARELEDIKVKAEAEVAKVKTEADKIERQAAEDATKLREENARLAREMGSIKAEESKRAEEVEKIRQDAEAKLREVTKAETDRKSKADAANAEREYQLTEEIVKLKTEKELLDQENQSLQEVNRKQREEAKKIIEEQKDKLAEVGAARETAESKIAQLEKTLCSMQAEFKETEERLIQAKAKLDEHSRIEKLKDGNPERREETSDKTKQGEPEVRSRTFTPRSDLLDVPLREELESLPSDKIFASKTACTEFAEGQLANYCVLGIECNKSTVMCLSANDFISALYFAENAVYLQQLVTQYSQVTGERKKTQKLYYQQYLDLALTICNELMDPRVCSILDVRTLNRMAYIFYVRGRDWVDAGQWDEALRVLNLAIELQNQITLKDPSGIDNHYLEDLTILMDFSSFIHQNKEKDLNQK